MMALIWEPKGEVLVVTITRWVCAVCDHRQHTEGNRAGEIVQCADCDEFTKIQESTHVYN